MPPGVLAPVPVSCVVGSKSEVSLLGYDACPTEVASNLRDCSPCVMCVSGRDLCSRNTRSPFLAQWYDWFFFSLLELMRLFVLFFVCVCVCAFCYYYYYYFFLFFSSKDCRQKCFACTLASGVGD